MVVSPVCLPKMYINLGERMETSAISGLAITTEWGDVSRRSKVPSFRTTMTGWPCGGMMSKAAALTASRQRANAATSPNTRRLIDKRLLHFAAAYDFDAALDVAAGGDRPGRRYGEHAADIGVEGEGGTALGIGNIANIGD